MTTMDDVAFWRQVLVDGQRTVMCAPDVEHRLRAAIDQAGLGERVTVKPSPVVAEGQVYLLDEHALEAQIRQAATRVVNDWRRRERTTFTDLLRDQRASLAVVRPMFAAQPTYCEKGIGHREHRVTADNPLPQGRCLHCRRLVRRLPDGRWAVSTS